MKNFIVPALAALCMSCQPDYKQEGSLYSRTITLTVFKDTEAVSSTLFEYSEFDADSNEVYVESYYGSYDDADRNGKLHRVVEFRYDGSGRVQKQIMMNSLDRTGTGSEVSYTYSPEGKLQMEENRSSEEKTLYNYTNGRIESKATYAYPTLLFGEAEKGADSTLRSLSLFAYNDKEGVETERLYVNWVAANNKADTTCVGFYRRKLGPDRSIVSEEHYGADSVMTYSLLVIRDEKGRVLKEITKEHFGFYPEEENGGGMSPGHQETVKEFLYNENNLLHQITKTLPDKGKMVFDIAYN